MGSTNKNMPKKISPVSKSLKKSSFYDKDKKLEKNKTKNKDSMK